MPRTGSNVNEASIFWTVSIDLLDNKSYRLIENLPDGREIRRTLQVVMDTGSGCNLVKKDVWKVTRLLCCRQCLPELSAPPVSHA